MVAEVDGVTVVVVEGSVVEGLVVVGEGVASGTVVVVVGSRVNAVVVSDVVSSEPPQPAAAKPSRTADGTTTPVGNTVDLETATWSDTIGDVQLATVWTDPDFDPAQPAFYYARVIEIPTPRWTAYDAVKFDLELPEDIPLVIQERAYTSPIWYTPK